MRLINVGSTVYYARVHHATGTYDLCELWVRTVYPESFVGVDKKDKRAFILSYDECDISVFDDRELALAVVKEAEKRRKELTTDASDEE